MNGKRRRWNISEPARLTILRTRAGKPNFPVVVFNASCQISRRCARCDILIHLSDPKCKWLEWLEHESPLRVGHYMHMPVIDRNPACPATATVQGDLIHLILSVLRPAPSPRVIVIVITMSWKALPQPGVFVQGYLLFTFTFTNKG